MSYRILDPQAVLRLPLTGIQLIEASAGTGKTYTIANLYLRHIISGREVGGVLVVTFTVAATDELRGRIRARLFETLEILERQWDTGDPFLSLLVGQIRAQGQVDLSIKRLRLAVRTMDEAAIYTIHSFCQRTLTEFAFNSGQQFQFEVLTDDRDLWRQAVQDWWRRTGYPLDATQARLFSEALGSLESFRTLLQPLLSPQEKQLLPPPGPLDAVLAGLDEMVSGLREIACRWREDSERLQRILLESKGLSRAQTGPYKKDTLKPVLAFLEACFASATLPPPDVFCLLTDDCIDANRLTKPDPELDDPFFAHCGRLWRSLELLKRDLRTAALADAAAFVRSKVWDTKQRAQVLAFDDLLSEMNRALQRENGAALGDAVRQQFPVAMIDEFQDTDPVQYGIFRQLYLGRSDLGLIMIGDPKQAIYSFRGGDIFTYMQAKEDVGDDAIYTLGTNWRSTPNLVNAVNKVFQYRDGDAFVYGDAIPFTPISAAQREHRYLTRAGEPQAAMTLWTLPPKVDAKGQEKAMSKDDAHYSTHESVACEVVGLIAGGRQGLVRIGTRPLLPRDIAILVRTSYEAAELRKALVSRGVRAVSVERERVFGSSEAGALDAVLRAVINPRDRDLARLALVSPLLGKDYAEVERIIQGEDDWMAWVDDLLRLHEVWRQQGFMAMFQKMLGVVGIVEKVGREPLAERGLTNILHLGELLQQASKAHAGMDALLTWYRRQREESAADQAELRLESDEDLVQIVTIHASKGLEYPVVFVPYLWGCKPRGSVGLVGFHRNRAACLDAGSDDLAAHLFLAEKERLAEDVRLAYVALTRAASALYLVWGRAGSRDGHAGQTALGYLLHPYQSSDRLDRERPDAFAELKDLGPDLQRLASSAGGDLRVEPLPGPSEPRVLADASVPQELAPRTFNGRIATNWRISSFSALSRDVHSGPAPSATQVEDDIAFRFPAGSHVGSYLHLLLEELDFQADVEQQVLTHSAQIAARFNLDHEQWGQDAAAILRRVTQTPLDGQQLMLARLSPRQRLNELEFDFATRSVDIPSLNELLEQAAGEPLSPLEIETFQGMVNGVIDLVFQHRERFFIADYKSNFLGGRFADYAPDGLRQAVYERRYDLQFLLYTLALHRYLRNRLVDYSYEHHFGGVYYLFLRGMRPQTGAHCGVYYRRPDIQVVERLDRYIFGCDATAES